MTRLIIDLASFLGLSFVFFLVGLKVEGPLRTPLPAGQAVVVTLFVTVVDALVAFVMDAREEPRGGAPDDTG